MRLFTRFVNMEFTGELSESSDWEGKKRNKRNMF